MLCFFYYSFIWVLFLKFNGRIISSFVFVPFASSIKVFIFYQNVKTSYFKCQLYNIIVNLISYFLFFFYFTTKSWWCFDFYRVKYLHLFWFIPLTKYLNYVTIFPSVFFSLLFKFNFNPSETFFGIWCEVRSLPFFVFQMVNYCSIILWLSPFYHQSEMLIFSYTKYLDIVGSTYGFSTVSY